MSFLQRYLNGDFETVWHEINRLQDIPSPGEEDIRDVCSEIIRRVNLNIDTCIRNISLVGYQLGFDFAEDEETLDQHLVKAPIRELPNRSLADDFESFEQQYASLPLFMKYWFAYVGGVNFIGKKPLRWKRPKITNTYQEIDPLYILSFDTAIRDHLIENDHGQLNFAISAEVYSKLGMSGGGSYRFPLGVSLVDAHLPIRHEEILFVDYIRSYLRDGGLYGVETWDGVTKEDLRILRSDIIDF
jgi:hypothetical protein